MTDDVERYRKQLAKNPARGKVLRQVEQSLAQSGDDALLAELLGERLQALQTAAARPAIIDEVVTELRAALLRHARSGTESLPAARAALRAAALAAERSDDEGRADAALWALVRGVSDDDIRSAALSHLGSIALARERAKASLNRADYKDRKGALRHTLACLAEIEGDHDAAFFEALRAARTTPVMKRYLDEAFRLALVAGRFEEVALVFADASAESAGADAELRTYLRLKLAHILTNHLDRSADALEIYREILARHPDNSEALKRAERLAGNLGVPFEPPPPLPTEISLPGSQPPAATPEDPRMTSDQLKAVAALPIADSGEVFASSAADTDPERVETAPATDADASGEPAEAESVFSSAAGEIVDSAPEVPADLERRLGLAADGVIATDVSEPSPPVVDAAVEVTDLSALAGDPLLEVTDHAGPPPGTGVPPPDADDEPDEFVEISDRHIIAIDELPPTPAGAAAPDAEETELRAQATFDPEALERTGDWHALAAGLLERLPPQPTIEQLLRIADLFETRLGAPGRAFPLYARAIESEDDALAVAGLLRCAPGAPDVAGALCAKLAEQRGAGHDVVASLTRIVAAGEATRGQRPAAAARLAAVFSERSNDEGLFRQLDRLYRDLEQPANQAELRAHASFGDATTRNALLTERIDLLIAARQPAAAFEAARAAQAAQPNDPALAQRVAELAASVGDTQARMSALLGVMRSATGSAALAAARELAALASESGDSAGALSAWREVLKRQPDDAEALRALGDLLADDPAQHAELIEILQRRLDLARRNDDEAQQLLLLHRLADLYRSRGRLGEQETMLKRALEVDPDDEAAFDVVAQRLTTRNAWPELAALLQQQAARRTDAAVRAGLWLRAAELLAGTLKQRTEAYQAYQKALALEPDRVEALVGLAGVCAEIGETDAAASFYERAVTKLSGEPLAACLCRLGQLYDEKLGRSEQAVRVYRRALETDIGNHDAVRALKSLYRSGQQWDALAGLLEGQAATGEGPEAQGAALFEAATVLLDQLDPPQPERAEQLLRRALELAPALDDGRDRLASVLAARGDQAGARELLEELLRRRGSDGLSESQLLLLASACAAQGLTAAAQNHLRQLLKRVPSHLVALRTLGELLLADGDADAEETIAVLEQRLLHHGPKLDRREAARVHGQIGILRRGRGDMAGARKALRHALNLMDRETPDLDVLAAHAELLIDENNIAEALSENERLAQLLQGIQAAARWMLVGQLAETRADDQDRAAHAYAEACRLDPNRVDGFEGQLRVEAARGNAAGALRAAETLLEREVNLQRLSRLEAAVAAICLTHLNDPHKAAGYLKHAIEHDAENVTAIAAAEKLFEKLGDVAGLNQILSQALARTPREHADERRALLERLVQLRRYELRDLPGAITALEELLQLDDDNGKAREDLGRLLTEVGAHERALTIWREVLLRDPLAIDAYRAMFNIVRRQRAFDQAFGVAATMVALEKADDEVRSFVKQLRAPFPNWPKVPTDPKKVRQVVLHPAARGPVRDMLALAAPVVWPQFARELKDFGLRRRDLLATGEIPNSVLLAVRQAAKMLNLAEPEMFRGATTSTGVSLLPVDPPALLIGADVLRGGMTPERAFAFGRAIAYLQPENLVAASLTPNELRGLIESVLLIAMPKVDMDPATRQFAKLGHLIEKRVRPAEADRLIELGRDYYRVRAAFSIQELIAALGYSTDRVGFVFAGELAPAVAALKAAAGQENLYSARLAIKELVLFSVSADYFTLRRELGLTVHETDAERVLGLG